MELSPRMHDGCPHNCQDRLGWLPDVMSFHVLSYLDPGIVGCVCFLFSTFIAFSALHCSLGIPLVKNTKYHSDQLQTFPWSSLACRWLKTENWL